MKQNLIFLISQPRSGSSLLQQILTSNTQILSFPEPWFILPLLNLYKKNVDTADYNALYADVNFQDFIKDAVNGKEKIKEVIRKAAFEIYNINIPNETKPQYILDKTPRYYHIIEEIVEVFPESKIIILIRNPVAVFSSILNYNFQGNFINMFQANDRLADIYKAPQVVAKLYKKSDNRFLFVHYEKLIGDTSTTLAKIYRFLGIDEYSIKGKYELGEQFQDSKYIDTKSVRKHSRPVNLYLDSWKSTIDNSAKKRILLEYIHNLGMETINSLGYSFDNILENITQHSVDKSSVTIPIKLLQSTNRELSYINKKRRSLLINFYNQGKIMTFKHYIKKLIKI